MDHVDHMYRGVDIRQVDSQDNINAKGLNVIVEDSTCYEYWCQETTVQPATSIHSFTEVDLPPQFP